MKFSDRIRNFLYSLRYLRCGVATSVAFIKTDEKKQREFNARMARLAESTVPCRKSCDEIIAFLKQSYGAQVYEPSPSELNMFKINYILGACPKLLKTEEYKPKNGSKPLSRAEYVKFTENSQKRFEEAMAYPAERLGLNVKACRFAQTVQSGAKIRYTFIMDEKSGFGGLSSVANTAALTETDVQKRRKTDNEVTIFSGVDENDIKNLTPRFVTYALAVENSEKI